MGVSVLDMCVVYVFFFFQAEDGIRDYKVTGVQTCALPISGAAHYGSEIPGQTTGLSTDPPDNLTVIRGKQSQARRLLLSRRAPSWSQKGRLKAGCGHDCPPSNPALTPGNRSSGSPQLFPAWLPLSPRIQF